MSTMEPREVRGDKRAEFAGVSRDVPTQDELARLLVERSNWGRWGNDDQRGTLNLITTEKRVRALGLARSGRTVSLSRPLPTAPGPGNLHPAQHYMKANRQGTGGGSAAGPEDGGGYAADYYGMYYHGPTTTHLDALCHVWGQSGELYNGRKPDVEIGFDGSAFGGIEQWSDGIITRGVFLDVPRHRGNGFVTQDSPVHGWELEDILEERGINLEPGDAVCVYSGREAWQRAHPQAPYARVPFDACGGGTYEKPGLHASCLAFLRRHDVGVLVWDMLDATPFEYEVPWTVHASIHAFGLALLDNALLEPLVEVCADENTNEFLLVVSPLVVDGGTGSPVNPLAIF